jgi:hypothetical protein
VKNTLPDLIVFHSLRLLSSNMSSRVDGSSAMDGMQGSESEEGRSLPVPDLNPKRIRERPKAWSFEDTF